MPEKELKPGPGIESRKLASFWIDQCHDYESDRKGWFFRGDAVLKRFRDDRSKVTSNARRLNVLWANIKIMMPALYSHCPIPIIDRSFLDKDPAGRLAAQIAERAVRNEIKTNGMHLAIKAAVLDHLLPGQGQVWARYESVIDKNLSIPSAMQTSMEDDFDKIVNKGKKVKDTKKVDVLEETEEQVITESAPVDYINWKDFGMLPSKARTWSEVQAVYKRIPMSRVEAIERFGEEIGKEMQPITASTTEKNKAGRPGTSPFDDMNSRSIEVFEVWNKMDRKVYWVSPGYEYLCDVRDDPLELTDFFPCPMPLWATMTNDTLIPVPDYYEYQDQALQIDELTMRISLLAKACKVAGTYDSANGALKRLLQESTENDLIPVDQWAVHAEKGGVKGSISFLPLTEIQSVLKTLIEIRAICIQDLDLITGINDIMRGTTDSRETLGGIRLKNNNTGTRLSERQEEVARFARDTVKIVTEIICKHYTKEKLIESSEILLEDELNKNNIVQVMEEAMKANPQLAQQAQAMPPEMIKQEMTAQAEKIINTKIDNAIVILQKDIVRRYRIDIETDSTVYADAAQDKENATNFIGMFMKFMDSAEKISENLPEAMPLMGKMLEFGIRKFRAGRDLESAISQFVDKITKKSQDMINNPKPDPNQVKIEGMKIQQQGDLAKIQATAKAQEENDQRSAQIHQQEAAQSAQEQQRETAKDQQDAQLKAQIDHFNMQIEERKFNMEMAKLDRQAQIDQLEFDAKIKLIKATNEKKDGKVEA